MRRHPFSRFTRPLVLLAVVIAYGTVGYWLLGGWSVLEALFMTVITITTVGYEEVHPLDARGEAFSISLIVFGVIGFLYTFGVIVEVLGSGRWQQYRRYKRMQDQLARLRDHVIVCGYGRTGKQVVTELVEGGHPYVVVEMTPQPYEEVQRDRHPHVHGDAANDEVLHAAGIDRARALVSAVDSDERNVYIVLTARSINPRLFIVARSSYPDSMPKLRRAGADRVVSPYTISGRRMAALALQPAVVDTIDIVMGGESGTMAIEELVVPAGTGPLTAGGLRRSGAVLLAVRSPKGDLSVGPDDSHALDTEDLVVAMGTRSQLDALADALRPVAASG
ncbi:MAG TPA: potassium channel family protein [Candidatus Dormibacteraeota bacterium]|jgi:voltage-gated potassium channel|nr:potassium channel family protein [Candidatus Dormibacteraeota bacterium]